MQQRDGRELPRMASSLDGALRKAAASGGIGVLTHELVLIATAAGLSGPPSETTDAPTSTVSTLSSVSLSPNGDASENETSSRELEIRLPGSGSKHAGGSMRVLVEDVTEDRKRSEEQRDAAAARKEFFTLRRFLPFANKLVATVGGEWLPLMSDSQRQACFDIFFVNESDEATLPCILALGAVLACSDSYTTRHLVHIANTWLVRGGIERLLRARCNALAGGSGINAEHFADALQVLVSMPDRIANRLQGRLPPEFQPSVYYSNLVSAALACVKSDAMALLREVGGAQGRGDTRRDWVSCWIGVDQVFEDSQQPPSTNEDRDGRGERVGQGLRQRMSQGLCAAVAELLGKISISGKSRIGGTSNSLQCSSKNSEVSLFFVKICRAN